MNFTEAESKIYELQRGDILVAEASGSASEVGKPAIWSGEIVDCCYQNTLIRVRSRGPLAEYLRWFLLGEAYSGRFGNAAPGVGIHHIGAFRLSAWPVNVPPLNEQERIVAAIEAQLSHLDAADSLLRKARARADSLVAAILSNAVGHHPRVALGDITDSLRYGTSVRCLHDAYGPAVLRIPNIRHGRVDSANLKYATVDASALGDCFVKAGDLLFVRTNGSRDLIGRVAAMEGAEPMAFASYLIRARPNPALLDPAWAVLSLRTPELRAMIESRAATTAGQYNLNLASLRSLEIPLPPIDEQRRIAVDIERQLSTIDALTTGIANAAQRSTTLRRSVLERAVCGELTQQVSDDEPASALLERIKADRVAAPRARRETVSN